MITTDANSIRERDRLGYTKKQQHQQQKYMINRKGEFLFIKKWGLTRSLTRGRGGEGKERG